MQISIAFGCGTLHGRPTLNALILQHFHEFILRISIRISQICHVRHILHDAVIVTSVSEIIIRQPRPVLSQINHSSAWRACVRSWTLIERCVSTLNILTLRSEG